MLVKSSWKQKLIFKTTIHQNEELYYLLSFIFYLFSILSILLTFAACASDDIPPAGNEDGPQLSMEFHFNPNQERLNNFGLPQGMPAGHAGVSPEFNAMSAHYVELAATAFTPLGTGAIIYQGAETTDGGEMAIDFDQEVICAPGATFMEWDLSEVPEGTYEYIRISLSYQNYTVPFRALGIDLEGTLASFLGYNTYIENHTVNQEMVEVSSNKKQGYWAFETQYGVHSGDASNTTVPNPISASSPIPAGSCLLTARFNEPFQVTGEETDDQAIRMSISTKQSFEWIDTNNNGIWEPLDGELVVDMGVRGMKAEVVK